MLDHVEHHNGIERRMMPNILCRKCPLVDIETALAAEAHRTFTDFDPLHFKMRARFGEKKPIRTSEFQQLAVAAACFTEILNGGPKFAAQNILTSGVIRVSVCLSALKICFSVNTVWRKILRQLSHPYAASGTAHNRKGVADEDLNAVPAVSADWTVDG